MNTRDILAALQAKTITPAEAKEAIAALGRAPQPAPAEAEPTPPVKRTSALNSAQLEQELATSLAEALYVGRDDLDVSRPFAELGLDSIIGVEWVRVLNKRYGLSIPATRLYDYGTLQTLAGYIAGELGVDVAPPASSAAVPAETPAVMVSDARGDGEALHAELAASLASALYVGAGDIGLDTPFAELGLDSIIGVEWVRTINKRYQIALAATRVYDYPTIRTLAAYLAGELELRVQPVAPMDDGPHPPFGHLLPEGEGPALGGDDGIAIIGMAGQFPGAVNLDELWANLAAGRDCISEVPASRWAVERFFDADPAAPGKTYSKWMGVLENADKFDPMFFNLSPAEAEWMDPQQRLFLEASWHAVEDAAINPATLSGKRCGVFAGCAPGDYGSAFGREGLTPEALMGLSLSMLAARIAYFLNLKGPCLAIETACSSSLVAVAQACDSLLLGESDLALAGGVCVLAGPRMHIMTSKAGMLSKEGRCFTFDERADGFVPGEGVGVLLLKRLSDAVRDGDRIAGVLRGWGVNQDGKTNGITAPSMNSQVRLEKGVYDRFGIDPRTISLMEAHGTGTRLGDPIEVEALSEAFGSYGPQPNRCAIGSVKSNIGHLLAAAGIAGVIKVLLAMRHKVLPPAIHFQQLNGHIPLDSSPFYVNTETREWLQEATTPRRAAVSSFGFSGTNAHVVIEEYATPARSSASTATRPALIVLSAKNRNRLQAQAAQLLAAVEEGRFAESELPAIAYTLQVGREAMECRLAMVVRSLDDLSRKLQRVVAGDARIEELFRGEVKRNKEALSLFADEDDLRRTMAGWIERQQFERLLKGWVSGLEVDWTALYGATKPARLSLPLYPFARDRYWVSSSDDLVLEALVGDREGAQTVRAGSALELVREEELFEEVEEELVPAIVAEEASVLMTFEEVLEEVAPADGAVRELRTVVCFLTGDDDRATATRMVGELAPGATMIFVGQSEQYERRSAHDYGIVRADGATYAEALRAIARDHGSVDAILYLWAVEDRALLAHCGPIVHLVQAIDASQLSCPHLWLAGRSGSHLDRCHLDSWIGFERSLPQVLPRTRVSVLDSDDSTALFGQLWREAQSDGGSAVYRQGRRSGRNARPTRVEGSATVLRTGGTYLITGGTGALGWLFAEHLATRYEARLILTGRSPLDEERQARIDTLRQRGTSVLYLQGDVRDAERMRDLVQQASGELGPIHGVIHAAGLVDPRSLLERDLASFERVAGPKVAGTLALDEALQFQQQLDFIAYFSSSSAVLGDMGWCDYAVGSRFQLAYAGQAAALPRRIAMAWPLWEQGGMNFEQDASRHLYLASSGQRLLETAEGLEIFERLLARGGASLVMAGQPSKVQRFLGITSPLPAEAAEGTGEETAGGRAAAMKGWTLEQCIAWDVKEQASQLLKISRGQLDVDANLADFGLDSIGLSRYARQLSAHFGAEIIPAVFFSYPTLAKLCEYLLADHRAEMEAFYREEKSTAPAPAAKKITVRRRIAASAPTSATVAPVVPGTPEPIAIIGMSGRFPQARSVDELWQILADGREVVEEIPAERFDWRQVYGDPRKDATKTNSKWSGCIPGVKEFDALFFEISPREAELMDPRQRLLLQEAWKALEDAGYGSHQMKSRRIGMFVGAEQGDFQQLAGPGAGLASNHDGMLAARLSYFLNLGGPAMTINTACSSGLVAAHQACQSLRSGECDTAIAAGVNILLTPTAYVGMGQAGMLSPDGKCYAFDARANGLVPGEAVVAVVLKRLSQAEADGDPIHAVIRGSGINYDGRTNGITAPNGASQASLLREVYTRSGVSVRDLDYVITHGTGTQLGDPVEINALYDAFKESTSDAGFCALTSTKTNVGHTFAASGLVSLTALVRAMQHEQIPASLNCETENDYIRWQASPFYVNKANRPWPARAGGKRLGAVSSFGMSGTNAHMVVESYSRPRAAETPLPPFFLLVLSAKTAESLVERGAQLRQLLREQSCDRRALQAMSHTLLCGRQHFEHRLALVVSDGDNALQLLLQAGGKEKLPNLFAGIVDREFSGQKVILRYAEELLGQLAILRDEPGRYQETLYALADFYCQGYELPWERLSGEAPPARIALPTYPFAREQHWPAETDRRPSLAGALAMLHPLVQQNTSDLSEQRFTSTFSGTEPFLADHVVKGMRVLPGVAYLEMARAAVEQAGGLALEGEGSTIRLEHVVFARPFVVSEPRTVHTSLLPGQAGEIAYEIHSSAADGGPSTVHSQGVAVFRAGTVSAVVDLAALRSRCSEGPSAERCYEAFQAMGLDYGPAHRGLRSVSTGRDANGVRFVLAEVALPESVSATAGDFVLHPCVMDAALQASIGLLAELGSELSARPLLPFAIEALEIFASCPSDAVVIIREAAGSSEQVQKLDIDLCDARGHVAVRFHAFSARLLDGDVAEARSGGVAELLPETLVAMEPLSPATGDREGVLEERAVLYLKKVVAKTLKLELRRVEAKAPFEKYGIDSIVVMDLTQELEKGFGSLSKTLFFEYQTIDALAGYFLAEHRDALMKIVGADASGGQGEPLIRPSGTFSRREKGLAPDSAGECESPLPPGRALVGRGRFAVARHSGQPAGWQDVAIIGMSGRYPQAENLAAFWENLKAGRDSITEIPAERWDSNLYFDPQKGKAGKSFSKWGGFIDGVDRFDPLFFNISPREAELMDPQERLFLQCVYETLEDAGYTRESLAAHQGLGLEGNVGVFVGVMYEEYQLFGAQAQTLGKPLALFGSPSSIANRISYFCNFHGPSMALDTMCSSSLTAIHLACHTLQRGGCEVAIAGGVNVSIHPNKYLTLSQGQFASSKGRCESFGEGGDGYVPGEGVGAVLLKPLAKAIADGDQIHAVIKGSAVNHGGKTNGYSVPNPNAQANVISQALRESGVTARAISYIEAHGTGTSLGDPIEIAGLSKVFAESTRDRQFCAIGSAKSNIGHCESAAGIAGVTKVVLQMKHGQLVPSLHSESLNPHIDFAASPFVVQQELEEWKRPVVTVDGREQERPRIAGISSFGAGGSNAHLVIEEYVPAVAAQTVRFDTQRPAIIVLSARTEGQLLQQSRNLLAALEGDSFGEADLANIAYTLQVGREAMEHRLALTVVSLAQLREKLLAILAGEEGLDDVHRGALRRSEETLAVFTADEDMQRAIEAWVAKAKYGKLLDLWVKGLAFDWSRLQPQGSARRVSLPTYPFARERYWAPLPELLAAGIATAATALHPLLQQNTSDFSEQRFTSTFTGTEPFLADHLVQGTATLPATAYLEIVRAAVALAGGVGQEQQVELRNVIFSRPLAVGEEAVTLHVGLAQAEGEGEVAYEVYSTAGAEETIHCQGSAFLLPRSEERPAVDLAALRSACTAARSAEQCYETFQSIGLQYGRTHRALETVRSGVGIDGNRFALATLAVAGGNKPDGFVLHPGFLDAALQAFIGLIDDGAAGRAYVPFALDRLEVFAATPERGYAYLRAADGASPETSIRKIDIDVTDDQGRLAVRLQGLSLRALQLEARPAETETLLFTPQWRARVAAAVGRGDEYGQRWLVLCASDGVSGELLAALATRIAGVRTRLLDVSASSEIGAQASAAVTGAFELIQQILQEKPKREVLLQFLAPEGDEPLFAGLVGLLRTAHQENPKLVGQWIGFERGESVESLIHTLETEAGDGEPLARYRGGERQVERCAELTPAVEGKPWKDGGVYLIAGGAGGLGLLFAREIAASVQGAKLVLTGRSSASEARVRELESLQINGTVVDYRQADVADRQSVEALIEAVRSRFGTIDGVIHSAGVLHDGFLLKKERAELENVLAPKVAGLVNLDEATRELPLDFFVVFSSLAAILGNVGQGDYASANAFVDQYARYRHGLVGAGWRHGRTLSLNWPLWREGGMRVDAGTLGRMRSSTGLTVLETVDGLRAFYQALASGQPQVVVASGEPARVRLLLQPASMAVPEPKAVTESSVIPVERDLLRTRTLHYLTSLLASALKLEGERIDAEAPLERYGIDSVLVMQLTGTLEESLGSLSKTLFFEYQTLDALAGYLAKAHRHRLAQLLEIGDPPAATEANQGPVPALAVQPPAGRRSRFGSRKRRAADVDGREQGSWDIAIIGLSGRYPQAANVAAFWENLRDGKDCITEVPKERWDHSVYFDEEKGKFGKSYSKWGGFLDGIDRFDPLFFNISPREAEATDPQERLFLQCVYEALEDSGYTREALGRHNALGLEGNVGVFVGVMYEEYQLFGAQAQLLGKPFALPGNPSSIANRVSYFCNFHGPSIALDTMCSSSLTAIHLACESLQRGGCEVAIAGGVNVSVHPNKYLGLSQWQFVSSDGRCESFGEGGDGYVPGEGVGAVLLKPLARAIADGDQIYAVIKASAINHGGRTNGYSVPNPQAQANVITQALQSAGVPARAVSYIEAHGTGTKLGDPIEIAGLSRAFSESTADRQFCAIGSAKSNIGHCESAAGIAGLTKVLLQMKHGMLAPSLHAETLNPYIDFAGSPFVVQRELAEWKRPLVTIDGRSREVPRIAGISSFGAGGSNAHLVIEEYVAPPTVAAVAVTPQAPAMIVLSAKSEEQLRQQAVNLLDDIATRSVADDELAAIGYTLQVGREAMEQRLALTAASVGELQQKLGRFLAGEANSEVHRGEVKRNKEALSVFAADEELQEAIGKWIARGKFAKLLELWVKGLLFDWNRLYGQQHPRRTSLPTYPFAQERYWIEIAGLAEAMASSSLPASISRPPAQPAEPVVRREERFLVKGWQPAPTAGTRVWDAKLLILTTPETSALAAALAQRFPGSAVLNLAHGEPGLAGEHYDCWVDLTGCGLSLDHSLAWVAVLQQWIEREPKQDRLALCVTRGLEATTGETINLAGASRAGLYRMLQSEYGHLRSRHLDVDLATDDLASIGRIAAEVLAEGDEAEVRYRNGERSLALLQEIVPAASSGDRTFPADRVLWVTGGTRGLGLLCAQHFVRNYGARRLVLHGREALPPRERWAELRAQGNAVARKVVAIEALEAEGVGVRISSVELTDGPALAAELADVKQAWGAVGGIIHAAGMMDLENPAFVRKSVAGMQAVLAPKVAGLDQLIHCFEQEPLQFFVLFSSVSSVVPTVAAGQSDYTMANAYMDYVASAHSSRLPLVSIQWPNWKESGLGEAKGRAYRQTALLSHTDAEGLRLLDRVLAVKPAAVILPAVVDAARWQPELLMRRTLEAATPAARLSKVTAAPQSTVTPALLEALQHWLLALVSERLNLPVAKLDLDTPLQDYGVDSVMLAQLLQPVSRMVGETLDPSILFEYPTLDSFALWLTRNHTPALSAALAATSADPSAISATMPAERQVAVLDERRLPAQPRRNGSGDIAVVGLACRFPGANNLDEYWQLLAEGRSAIRSLPERRFGPGNGRHAGVLDDLTHFDPSFFRIPASTAAAMDPQALLVLQSSLEACLHAGYAVDEVKGAPIGVYLGARSQHRPSEETLYAAQDPIVAVGQNYLASNVSRFFDFRGPSLVVDTACSSALVAMNLAAQALSGGDIDAALVGGVSLLESEAALRMFERRGLLHSDPRFHIFDRRANGTVLGEGVGMVLLKTLEHAERDGDTIHAVIKGIAINNDGRTAGAASPNLQARKNVMLAALSRSGKRPEDISYIDVNGSGSEVTDLIELKAIEAVYRSESAQPCSLGSMKPNIGHPLCAEGIASLIKVVLMLQRRRSVPFLSAEEPMTHYDLASSPFRFSRNDAAWGDLPRVAAINCFADGGTNAHVILEAWEAPASDPPLRTPIPPPMPQRIELLHIRRSPAGISAGGNAKHAPKAPAARASFWKRPLTAVEPPSTEPPYEN